MTNFGRIATLIAVLGVSIASYTHLNEQVEVADIPVIVVDAITFPTPIQEAEEVLVKIDPQEFECMQTNIYFEARNERDPDAFAAVGYSVINRMNHRSYPDTACGVVKEKRWARAKGRWVCQYSWFCDGKPDTPNLSNPIERMAWERAGEVAVAVMRNEVDNPIGNATMYHANYVKPAWDYRKLVHITKIGVHIFYEEKSRRA